MDFSAALWDEPSEIICSPELVEHVSMNSQDAHRKERIDIHEHFNFDDEMNGNQDIGIQSKHMCQNVKEIGVKSKDNIQHHAEGLLFQNELLHEDHVDDGESLLEGTQSDDEVTSSKTMLPKVMQMKHEEKNKVLIESKKKDNRNRGFISTEGIENMLGDRTYTENIEEFHSTECIDKIVHGADKNNISGSSNGGGGKIRIESGAAAWADELERAEARSRKEMSDEITSSQKKRRSKSGPHPAQLHWRSEPDPAFIPNIHRDLFSTVPNTNTASTNAHVIPVVPSSTVEKTAPTRVRRRATMDNVCTSQPPSSSSSSSSSSSASSVATTATTAPTCSSASSTSVPTVQQPFSGTNQIDEIMRSSYLDNREAMVTELDRIRNVLRNVLTKIDRNSTKSSQSQGGDIPVAQFQEAQQTVETLRIELEEQIMANSLLEADSNYLEQQLREKVRSYCLFLLCFCCPIIFPCVCGYICEPFFFFIFLS